MIRSFLSKAGRIVEREVAIDLVGAHVMLALPILATRLEKRKRPLHVGLHKR